MCNSKLLKFCIGSVILYWIHAMRCNINLRSSTHSILRTVTNYFTNSLEQSRSWNQSSSASPEIFLQITAPENLIQCPEESTTCPCHKTDQFCPSPTLFLEDPLLILISHLHLDLPSGFFTSGVPTKIPYALILFPKSFTCPSLVILI